MSFINKVTKNGSRPGRAKISRSALLTRSNFLVSGFADETKRFFLVRSFPLCIANKHVHAKSKAMVEGRKGLALPGSKWYAILTRPT